MRGHRTPWFRSLSGTAHGKPKAGKPPFPYAFCEGGFELAQPHTKCIERCNTLAKTDRNQSGQTCKFARLRLAMHWGCNRLAFNTPTRIETKAGKHASLPALAKPWALRPTMIETKAGKLGRKYPKIPQTD